MKTMHTKHHASRFKLLSIGLLFGAASLLAACGGGGGIAGVGSGGTGAVVMGPISGFGSVIVNGVRFDDTAATVTIDDNGGLSSGLKLGMMVEIQGTSGATSGSASSITAASHIQGPIASIATTADPQVGTLSVLGVTVAVNAGTIFENVSGLSGLLVSDVIEVYGLVNGPDGLTATRIERKVTTEVRSVGAIQALDTTAKTFTLHGITVNYTGATLDSNLGAGLANGTVVRVKGSLASGVIVATRVKAAHFEPVPTEGQRMEVEGVVSNFVSTANFEIQGLKIDASKLSPAFTIANGVRIEVEGTVVNGVLVASKVEQKNEALEAEFQLFGTVADLNAGAKTFTLRSGTVSVHWSGSTTFIAPLTEATMANGAKVEVKGNVVNGVVEATRIKLDN